MHSFLKSPASHWCAFVVQDGGAREDICSDANACIHYHRVSPWGWLHLWHATLDTPYNVESNMHCSILTSCRSKISWNGLPCALEVGLLIRLVYIFLPPPLPPYPLPLACLNLCNMNKNDLAALTKTNLG